MNVTEFAESWKKKMSMIDTYKEQVLIENSSKLKDIVKEQNLKGIGGDGQKITPKYKGKYYARKKNKQNSVPGYGNPDMHLTGQSHNKMFIVLNGKKVEYDSKTSYFKYVKSRFENAFSIAPKNLKDAWSITMPALLKKLR